MMAQWRFVMCCKGEAMCGFVMAWRSGVMLGDGIAQCSFGEKEYGAVW